jgi:hypothetical protein
MSRDAPRRAEAAAEELLDGAERLVPRPVAVPVEPAGALRSPILEHRPIRPLPPDALGLTVVLPPMGALVGPSRIALLVAAPVWLAISLQAALLVAVVAFAYRFMHGLGDRAGFSIGEGFLPYRAKLDWPQGVQEDDDVRWNWSPARTGDARS